MMQSFISTIFFVMISMVTGCTQAGTDQMPEDAHRWPMSERMNQMP